MELKVTDALVHLPLPRELRLMSRVAPVIWVAFVCDPDSRDKRLVAEPFSVGNSVSLGFVILRCHALVMFVLQDVVHDWSVFIAGFGSRFNVYVRHGRLL